MSNIEQAARAEAERHRESTGWTMAEGHDIAEAFVAGASWLAEHLLSDESVELAAKAINPYREMLQTTARAKARAALSAALGTNHNEQEQGRAVHGRVRERRARDGGEAHVTTQTDH